MRNIAQHMQARLLKEQFIPDTVFLYVAAGRISLFNGQQRHTLEAGEGCLVRKNRLVQFRIADSADLFEPVLFCLDEEFLRQFQQKHQLPAARADTADTFISIRPTAWLAAFIRSLQPYTRGVMQLDEAVEEVKYEELLIILLKNQPELAAILFDYAPPEKINLEAFMNRNFRFNVSIPQFAYLTGRSLSAFKRDFRQTFQESPSRWLLQKRLHEAYFLLREKRQKPSTIYLGLGFETLSHFSFAFKKQFGLPPTELAGHQPPGGEC